MGRLNLHGSSNPVCIPEHDVLSYPSQGWCGICTCEDDGDCFFEVS